KVPETFLKGPMKLDTTGPMKPDMKGPMKLEMKLDEAKAIEAEIARLQERLAALKSKPAPSQLRATFAKDDLPLNPADLAALLNKLAEKKFKSGQFSIAASANGIVVEGDKEVIDWAATMIKRLSEK